MQVKAIVAIFFASVAVAAPPQADGSAIFAREPQGNCCSYIPGTCNCGCCRGGPCATTSDPNATCP